MIMTAFSICRTRPLWARLMQWASLDDPLIEIDLAQPPDAAGINGMPATSRPAGSAN
jgi:hypothetical protein